MPPKKCAFEGCKLVISEKQAETTEKLLLKPYCQAHAAQVSAETADVDAPELKIRRYLESQGFEEQRMKKGLWLEGESPHQTFVDMNKKSLVDMMPEIGVLQGMERITEGHGILKLDEVKQSIESILRSGKHEKEHKKKEEAKNETAEQYKAPKSEVTLPAGKVETPLTVETILKYIAPNATEQEAFFFLQLCKARNLNPFLKEAYIIKYSEKEPAAFVVGKDAFMKRADMQPDFLGFHAGIIIKYSIDAATNISPIERREGSLLLEGEILIGGWAEVFRQGREPCIEEVSLSEYIKKNSSGQPTRLWATMPATMIRKVALVHALREAFPQEFAGLYDSSEIQEAN